MIQNVKLENINNYSILLRSANEGKDTFPNELCDYLVNEFDLQASVLFSVEPKSSLSVIGRSSNAKGNFLTNAKFKCDVCSNLNKNTEHFVNTDSNCKIQISEFLIYESCIFFSIPGGNGFLIKIAKKSEFTQSDSQTFASLSENIAPLMYVWTKIRNGNLPISEFAFSKLVDQSTKSLRNSANSLLGITSILSEENLSGSQTEYVNNIKRNTQALLVAINDLKALTLIENSDAKIDKTKINIQWFVNEVVNLFKSRRSNVKLDIEIKFDNNLPKEIRSDELKLKYVINSLLRISTHLSAGKKNIVRVEPGAPGIIEFSFQLKEFSLSDSSISNFFNPVKITSDPQLKNCFVSGLETNLLQKYSKLLNGNVSVEKSEASGTVFTFRLKEGENSKLESAFSAIPKPSSINKVLVVEDDYATSKLLSNYLKKWGYDPEIVNTEKQIFENIENEKYLAIILDIELPNVNGLEVLRKINTHEKTKNTPVVVCSVDADEQKAYMMGAVEYFVKPINYNYLVEVLTSYKLRKDSKILCVDDDVPTLNLVKQAIETAGYNAIAEHISANVMDLISDKDIDLAIIDLDMPHPNGFELIKLIKHDEKFKNLPIIIYTGKENFDEDLKQIDGLFEELLDKKSVRIEDLADTINSMVNRYEVPPPIEEVIHKKDETIILLAEDYKHSQIIVTRLLKKNGMNNIVIVENGKEALELCEKENFNLILMDMQMPIMNGFEATQKIRNLKSYKDVPIIALTAFAMRGDREKCLAVGATDYIPKPIDSKEFIEKVKYYLNAQK